MIMIKKLLQIASQPTIASFVLLLLRLIAGTAFALHGWGKIQHPFGWVPEQAPISIPGFFQFLAAVSEFAGGIAWVMGLLTPIASVGIGCTMSVAVYMHAIVLKDPFVIQTVGSSYEPALVYLVISLMILVLGPGKFSLDKKIFGERTLSGD